MSHVFISAFGDEGVSVRNLAHPNEQVTAVKAAGLDYITLRAMNFESVAIATSPGNRNIITLQPNELQYVKGLIDNAGLKVSDIGTAIGKSSFEDIDRQLLHHPFKDEATVLGDLEKAFIAGDYFGTRILRGFSFAPRKDQDSAEVYEHALDLLGKIASRCQEHGFLYGLEVEANLIGRNGEAIFELVRRLGSQNVLSIYDGANLHVQGLDCFNEYQEMRETIGYLHVKDYSRECPKAIHIDEEALRHFCPADIGLSKYHEVLDDANKTGQIEKMSAAMKRFGAPGVFLVVEGHIKGGGAYGGYSGPDGLVAAVNGLSNVLTKVGIGFERSDYRRIEQSKNH